MSTIVNKSIIASAAAVKVMPKTVGGAKVTIPSTPRGPSRARAPLQALSAALPMPTTPIRRNVVHCDLELGDASVLSPVQPRKLDFKTNVGPRPALSAARLRRLAPRDSWASVVMDEIKPKSESKSVAVRGPVTPKAKVLKAPIMPFAPVRPPVQRFGKSLGSSSSATTVQRRGPRESTDSAVFGDIKPQGPGTAPIIPAATKASSAPTKTFLSPVRTKKTNKSAPRDSWCSFIMDEEVQAARVSKAPRPAVVRSVLPAPKAVGNRAYMAPMPSLDAYLDMHSDADDEHASGLNWDDYEHLRYNGEDEGDCSFESTGSADMSLTVCW